MCILLEDDIYFYVGISFLQSVLKFLKFKRPNLVIRIGCGSRNKRKVFYVKTALGGEKIKCLDFLALINKCVESHATFHRSPARASA